MTTLGSVAGCFVLYSLGRRGGEAFLERRFGKEQVARSRALFRRWDVLALAVPAVMPPPMPFKIFVLSAGVFGLPPRRFALTVALARGFRYAFWGVLGVFYGDAGLEMLKAVDAWSTRNAPMLLSLLVAIGAAAVIAYLRYRRRRRGAVCYDDAGEE
jgi:membrane protein DedA with SNARE-associated domain